MKKLFFILLIAMMASLVWAQVTEDFEGDYFNVTSDFTDGSFIGKGGATWSYYQSRDQGSYPINGNGIILRRPSDAYLEATISGGIGNFSFQYRKAETGGNPRQLELYVNGDVVWTSSVFGNFSGADATIYTMTEDVDVAGDVTIKIKNVGTYSTNRHSTIDNISWTGYDGAAIPTIAASGTLSAFNTSVGTPSAAQSYTLQGLNLTQNISVNAPAGFEISTDNETFTSSLSLAPAFSGSVYVRLTGATLGEFSGDITHTSSGATQVDQAVSGTVSEVLPEGYFVDFEGPGETKTAYASGTVNLSGLDWDMTEAVIGDLEDEVIEGTRSARFSGKNTSSMTMLQDKTGGLGTISFKYRKFRNDAQADWKVEYSTTAGASWIQIGDSFTATSTVQTFSETVDAPGNVRVKISVVGTPGTSNKRMNLDDILMTNYGSVVPFINVSGTLNAFATEVGIPSIAQTYSLSGDNLTSNIQVATPAGFEISSNGSTYSNSLSLSPNFDGSVYVRLAGTTLGDYSGNITHNSTDAQEVILPVSGEVYEPAEPGDPIVLFVEDFDYPVDTILEDTGGWLAHSGTNNPVMVVDGNLSYAGYIQNAGNMVELIATGQDVNHTFAPQTEGSVYAAVLINVDSAQATGDYFMHFGPETMTSIFAGRVFLKKDGDSDNAFIGLVYSSGAGAVTQYTTTSYPFGSTILLVLKYDITPGERNDVTSLFINPTPGAPEPTADLISASGYASAPADLVSVGSFGLRQGNANNAAVLGVDGIRITNDWNLLWTTDMPDQPMIYVEGEQEEPLLCVVGTPSEEYFEYTLYGEHLSGPITITAPEHFQVTTDPEGTWADQIQVSAAFNGSIYVRLTGTTAGEFSGNITHNSDGASEKTMAVSGTVLKQEPTNHPTGFAAEDGPNSYSDIKLTWVDAIGGVVPDGYLIKGSIIGFNDIANPVDGVAEESGDYIQDVAAGMETYTYTIFSGDTTYYFKIYPYTNSGDNINYKTDGVIQTVSHTTKSGPTLEEVLFPQYIQGHIADSDSNSERVAWAGRLTLKDLNPNSTYRYYGRFVRSSDGPSYNGAGVFVFVNADGTFSRSTAGTPSFNTAGTYSEFTTDSNGNYTGWFMGEPTGNERFTAEHEVYYRLMLNDGDGGTTVALRLTSQSSIKVLRFGIETSSAQGTLLWGVTDAPPKHFMFVYDNEAGTGRPINGNVIESDGIDLSNVSAIPGFYKANIEGIDGAWGMIIPNCLIPTGGPGFPGIKRIEIRDFATGDIYSWCTSPDAIWNGVDTFAPKGGLVNPLKIGCEEGGTVPVELSSFTATISANNFVQLNWVTQTETGVMGYYIYRAMDSDLASAILVSPMIAATNTSHAQSYAFVDSEIYEPGMYYYWLQNSDFDGSSNFHGPISIQFNMGGHDGSAPEIPLTTQLMAAFPNPFNPSTRIPYQLAKAGNVDIRIYNNRGQLVRSYPMGMKDAGYHSVTWDGLAEDGSECGTGIYYIRMQTGDKSYGSKAVMIK